MRQACNVRPVIPAPGRPLVIPFVGRYPGTVIRCANTSTRESSRGLCDDSGEWWTGSGPSDVAPYLAEYTTVHAAYPATAFRLIRCPCRSLQYRVDRAREVTRRRCAACKRTKFICRQLGDWQEAVAEEGAEPYRCVTCGSARANITVGFAGYPEAPKLDAVKWFYVGLRCVRCGVLCCFNDGKVARGPARLMYRRA